MPPLALPADIRSLVNGTPLVLLLDVDGTLAPLVPHHDQARVPDSTRTILDRLARHPDVRIALVSGRSADVAQAIVGVTGLWVCGNHGCELVTPSGERQEAQVAVARIGVIAEARRELEALQPEFRGLVVEDKRLTLSVHDLHVAPDRRAALHEQVHQIASALDLRVTEGKSILELRPTGDIHKGTAVMSLARDLGGLESGSTLVFAGDDVTDEDAFRTLAREVPSAITICIAEDPTGSAARYAVRDVDAMAALLAHIADSVDRRSAPRDARSEAPGA